MYNSNTTIVSINPMARGGAKYLSSNSNTTIVSINPYIYQHFFFYYSL